MTSRGRRSRIARFAQPFIVGALGTVALTSGCGAKSSAEEGCGEGCSQPLQMTCPNVAPKAGDECFGKEGLRCGDDEPCSDVGEFRCSDDGVWQDVSPLCHPLPRPIECDDEPCPTQGAQCPEVLPNVGDDCLGSEGLICEGDDPCDGGFQCSPEGVWQHLSGLACNPPPAFVDECPSSLPELGTSCGEFAPGLNCSYGDEACPPVLICAESRNWEASTEVCPVDPTGCPTQAMLEGQSCAGFEGLTCGDDGDCNEYGLFFCTDESLWLDVSPTCNPPPTGEETDPPAPLVCPPEPPNFGSGCGDVAIGTRCEYETESSCPTIVDCNLDAVWESGAPPCNPPPPEDRPCPAQEPTDGQSCDGVDPLLVCSYGGACSAQFVCANEGVWIDSTPTCNPPYIADAGSPLPVDTETDAGDAGDGG
jgi:hypothetical protein